MSKALASRKQGLAHLFSPTAADVEIWMWMWMWTWSWIWLGALSVRGIKSLSRGEDEDEDEDEDDDDIGLITQAQAPCSQKQRQMQRQRQRQRCCEKARLRSCVMVACPRPRLQMKSTAACLHSMLWRPSVGGKAVDYDHVSWWRRVRAGK